MHDIILQVICASVSFCLCNLGPSAYVNLSTLVTEVETLLLLSQITVICGVLVRVIGGFNSSVDMKN